MSELKYSKTVYKSGYLRKPRKTYEFIPEHARWLLYENQVILNNRMNFSKRTEAFVYTGAESLKYLGLVRRYVTARFKITDHELEIFLFLYPLNYFTKKDYNSIAQTYPLCSFKLLKDKGYISVMFNKKDLKAYNTASKDIADIYTLSIVAKRTVNYFYKLLSGEMKPFMFGTSVYSKSEHKNNLVKKLLEQMRDEE